MYNYTLGFIKYYDKILLLNREKAGWMGCWNGIGGKIEEGESPLQGIIREMKEETGIICNNIRPCGYVCWEKGDIYDGAYIFIIELDTLPFEGPIKTEEGILDWKHLSWIQHPRNLGIAKNVLPYINLLLINNNQYEFRSIWDGNNLIEVKIKELKEIYN